MKKLLFPLTFLLCLLLFACSSDSEIDATAILEIANTPIVETVPASKPVITQSAPITPTAIPTATATQIVIPTKIPQKSITENN